MTATVIQFILILILGHCLCLGLTTLQAGARMGDKEPLEERRKALERRFVERRPPLAYAKLVGRVLEDEPFESYVTHLPAELGRGPIDSTLFLLSPQQMSRADLVYVRRTESPGARVHLGEQKAISRLHARIQWSPNKSCFELVCLGKNGMFAAGKFVQKDQTIELTSKTPLKIGQARVYFVCAVRSVCSTMSGSKLVHRVRRKSRTLDVGWDGLA